MKQDYKLNFNDRPLSNSTVNRILFREIINNKKFRCPCKKFDNSFCCFTARDWINTAFELTYRPYNTARIYRKFEYQEKKAIYKSLLKTNKNGFVSNNDPTFNLNDKLEKCKTQIIKDIPRTFSNIDIFNYASVLQQLYRILYSYFIYDPELGYTQGMNLLVGALLMHAEESVAFWLFVTLIEDYEMRDVFQNSLQGVQNHCRVIKGLTEAYLPKLSRKFEELGVEIEMFASPWILSLFCGLIPVPFLHCFITRFFKYKWVAFYKILLSILKHLQVEILRCNDLTDFFEIIKALKMDQDYIEYEDRKYIDDPVIVENVIKWRAIIKNSDDQFPDIEDQILSNHFDYDN
jgi:hypothetical protein